MKWIEGRKKHHIIIAREKHLILLITQRSGSVLPKAVCATWTQSTGYDTQKKVCCKATVFQSGCFYCHSVQYLKLVFYISQEKG